MNDPKSVAQLDVLSIHRPPKFGPGMKVLYQEKEFTLPEDSKVMVHTFDKMPEGLNLTEQVDWLVKNAIYLYELFPGYMVAESTLNAA
jgi:hypothetical protein